jgi:hypothetical protein
MLKKCEECGEFSEMEFIEIHEKYNREPGEWLALHEYKCNICGHYQIAAVYGFHPEQHNER